MAGFRSCFVGFAAAVVAATIILSGTAHFVTAQNSHSAPAAPASAPIPVRTATVSLEAANEVVRYAAVVRPRVEADIGFRVIGKIVERFVDVATRVEAGTKLARLDAADFELQARAVEAQLVSAKADALNAQNDFVRYERLVKGGWTTQQEYDRRSAVKETSEARVRQLEAQLHVAVNNTQYAMLVADGPGVVTAVLAEPGQVVAQGQAVFKIARSGEVDVVADVPESALPLLDKAQLAAELWSMPGRFIAGRLRDVSPIADAATRTYRIRVTLLEARPEIQLGMTATLTVAHPRQARIARLPRTALTKKGADPAVWVVNPAGKGLELRAVTVGLYAGDAMTVMAGLKDGERVVTAGVHKLNASDQVRIWTEPQR